MYDPWMYRGKPFLEEDVGNHAGFVYLITYMPTGQEYIGKKFFHGMRKAKGKTRRSKTISDWQKYFSSSDWIKDKVKTEGPQNFKRDIIALHELKRDVNFHEVYLQFKLEVLDTMMDDGVTRRYLNENIQGKYFPHLVIGWKDRSTFDLCEEALPA